MTKLDEIARAIWDKHMCEYCVTSARDPLPSDCCCRDAAVAAVAALREPSEAMVQAGEDQTSENYTYDGSSAPWPAAAETYWQAMIDALLAEKPENAA